MLRCANCNTPLENDHKFCGACGAKVDRALPHETKAHPPTSHTPQAQAGTPGTETRTRQTFLVATLLAGLLLIVGFLTYGSSHLLKPSNRPSAPTTDNAVLPPPEAEQRNPTMTHQPPATAKQRRKTAALPLGLQPAALEGVVGQLWGDQSVTARICRKNGKCIPGEGSDIKIGDTIEAPNLAAFDIEDPDGFSRHGLTGKITDTQVLKFDDGSLALKVTLAHGKMEGTIRKLPHVIEIGSVYCVAQEVDYVAKASETGGSFEIEKGSGLCYDGKRETRVNSRNPVFEVISRR